MRASFRTLRCFSSPVVYLEAAQSDSKLFSLQVMGGPGL